MSEPIIEVENLGKRYRIGGEREKYLSLRDEIAKKLSPAHRRAESEKQDFWALKDVSFSVEEGEAVGIIGRNGAGKSTLLKILSQITPPTTGKITMRGRVASLLEVGTGFHPELTGRENIYLNGAVLGMTRREIARKFDEIVAFAEVEKFLDTPVKRYSSGMYVRLAFAVAAHLEPEILVVDEVLAVGDAQFQQKCLGKMGEVAKGGRTVLFVSHNVNAIRMLCSSCLLIDEGQADQLEDTEAALRSYLDSCRMALRTQRPSPLPQAILIDVSCDPPSPVTGSPIRIIISTTKLPSTAHCQFTMYSSAQIPLAFFSSRLSRGAETIVDAKSSTFIWEAPELLLTPGQYHVNVALYDSDSKLDHCHQALTFHVLPGLLRGSPSPQEADLGHLTMPHRWIRTVPMEVVA